MLQQILDNLQNSEYLLEQLNLEGFWSDESLNEEILKEAISQRKIENNVLEKTILEILHVDLLLSKKELINQRKLRDLDKSVPNSGISNIWMSYYYVIKGKQYEKSAIDISTEYFMKAYDILESLNRNSKFLRNLTLKIGLLLEEDENHYGAISYYLEIIEEDNDDKNTIKNAYIGLSRIYAKRGLYTHSEFYLARILALFPEEIEINDELIELQISIALFNGKFDLANYSIANYDKSDNSLVFKQIISASEHITKKSYDQALSILMYVISTEPDLNEINKGYLILKIGEIYILTNKHNEAIEYLDRAKNVFEKSRNYNGLIETYKLLGQVYYFADDYNLSLDYLIDALDILNQMNSFKDIFRLLFYIIQIKVRNNLEITTHLEQIKKLENFHMTEQQIAEKLLCQSLVLINEKTLISTGSAMSKLVAISGMKINDPFLQLYSSYYRIQLLFLEIILYGTESSIEKVSLEIDLMYKKSKNYKHTIFMIYALILRAQFFLITGNLQLAHKLVTQLEINAIEYNLSLLNELVINVRKLLTEQVDNIMSHKTTAENLYNSIILSKIKNYIDFFS